jgi:hypothetical protein
LRSIVLLLVLVLVLDFKRVFEEEDEDENEEDALETRALSRNSALTVRGTGYFIGGVLGIVASARFLFWAARFPALANEAIPDTTMSIL